MENENIKGYLTEFTRLLVIIVLLYLMDRFLSFLPFLSGFKVPGGLGLYPLLSLILALFCFSAVLEYVFRSRDYVDKIFKLFPEAGKIYSLLIYVLLALFLYYSAYDTAFVFMGEDWIWVYQGLFVGGILYILCKIGLTVYGHSAAISANLIEVFSSLSRKV